MALIKCKECGKEISSAADVCPNCGCPTDAGVAKKEKDEIDKVRRVLNVFSWIGCIPLLICLYNFVNLSSRDKYLLQHGTVTDTVSEKVVFWFGVFLAMFLAEVILRFVIGPKLKARENYNSTWTPLNINGSSQSSDGWRCSSCGKKNPYSSDMCSCGYSRNSKNTKGAWLCPACGKRNPDTLYHCSCGYGKE